MILYGSKEEIELRCSSCLKDESRLSGFADAAYFPESFDELVQTVRKFRDQKIPYTLSSGRTGISGGAVPQGGALLSLERLDRIIGIEQNDDTGRVHVRVEPGVRLAELEQFISTYKFVDNKKYHFPVDPTETTACLGGMVSLNASGSRSFRNGALRNHISALTVILPDGEILIIRRGDYPLENGMFEFESVHGKAYSLPWNLSRPTDIKNNAGIFFNEAMDLVDLFIGAEGVLGVIAEAEIMLVEAKPEEASFISFFSSEEDVLSYVDQVRKISEVLSVEYFGPEAVDLLRAEKNRDPAKGIPSIKDEYKAAILFELGADKDGMDGVLERISDLLEKFGSSLDATWDGTDPKEAAKLKLFRHMVPETINVRISEVKQTFPEIHKLGTDMAVPDDKFREMVLFYRSELDHSGLDFVIFGHIGDAHLHVNLIPRNPEEFSNAKKIIEKFAVKAVDLGGTVSAEHGIGKLKKGHLKLMYSESDLKAMKDLKIFFDPEMLLNRGNMF